MSEQKTHYARNATILSILLVGLGHLYLRQFAKGVLFMLLAVVNMFVLFALEGMAITAAYFGEDYSGYEGLMTLLFTAGIVLFAVAAVDSYIQGRNKDEQKIKEIEKGRDYERINRSGGRGDGTGSPI